DPALAVLSPMLERQSSVTLVVNDASRATPTGDVIDRLLAMHPGLELHAVVATGTHTPTATTRTQHEVAQLSRVASVFWHQSDAPEATRARIEGQALLAIGSVEPHYFAGWTGAHKTLSVGLWGTRHIERNHALALSPTARPATTAGNPVFDDVMTWLDGWIAARPEPVAAINLLADGSSAVVAAAGSPREALEALLLEASRRWLDRLTSPVDRLVAHVAPPLDRSLYQALKGFENHVDVVRDHGALVLVAACPDGVGIDHFTASLRAAADHASLASLIAARGYQLGDHKALRLRHRTNLLGIRLAIVAPGLLDADASLCDARRFEHLDDALTWARRVAPSDLEHVVHDAANRVSFL